MTRKDPVSYVEQLESMKETGRLNGASASELASVASNAYIDHFFLHHKIHDDALNSLCNLAVDENKEVAEAGENGLFRLLAERLSDSFDRESCALYDQAFIKTIQFSRGLPQGKALDESLSNFGLTREEELTDRKKRLSEKKSRFEKEDLVRVKKCLILSRVSLGADIAVTSVVIQKMLASCPNAEVVLLGDDALGGIFTGLDRFHVRHFKYPTSGGLFEKLGAWIELCDMVRQEINGLDPSEYIAIDPDSRMTQLGHLPLFPDQGASDGGDAVNNKLMDNRPVDSKPVDKKSVNNKPENNKPENKKPENKKRAANDPYLFFQSRSFVRPGVERISELTDCWLTTIFGGDDARPFVNPGPAARDYAASLRSARVKETALWVSVAFGVGGNEEKRVGNQFESDLIKNLASGKNRAVLLFKGADPKERDRADRMLDGLANDFSIAQISGSSPDFNSTDFNSADFNSADFNSAGLNSMPRAGQTGEFPDIIAWDGPLDIYCALIAESDIHIGYDSSNQHIAAASSVPLIDIFAHETAPVFAKRWTPSGDAPIKPVFLFEKSDAGTKAGMDVVMSLFSSLADSCSPSRDTD